DNNDIAHNNINHISTITSHFARGVVVEDNLAYVANDNDGFLILDVSDPIYPEVISSTDTPGFPYDIELQGNIAGIADYTRGLQLFDVSDPSNPEELSLLDTGGQTRGIALDGDLAVLAHFNQGLVLVDISDPNNPSIISSFETPGNPYNVVLVDGYALVADDIAGLSVFDISDPHDPIFIISVDTDGYTLDVGIDGNYAFVADDSHGLIVFDISDIDGPEIIAEHDTRGNASSIQIHNGIVYLADHTEGIVLINIEDPLNPFEVGFYDTIDIARDVFPFGEYAIVADGEFIHIFDCSEAIGWGPGQIPDLVTQISTDNQSLALSIEGNLLYLADGEGGLKILDKSDIINPIELSVYESPGYSSGLIKNNDFIVLADGAGGVRVINIENPNEPFEVESFDTPGVVENILLNNELLFVSNNEDGIRVLDFSDPENLIEIGSIESHGSAADVAVQGNIAYVADYFAGVAIIDITDPANMIEIAIINYLTRAAGVTIDDDILFVADHFAGVHIFDISTPESPVELSTIQTDGYSDKVNIFGDYALISDRQSGFLIANISDPSEPEVLYTQDTNGDCWEIQSDGRYFYVADGDEGVLIFVATELLNWNMEHFTDLIEPTPTEYLVSITQLDFLEDENINNGWLGIFDGQLCVGRARFQDDLPVQITTWQQDIDEGLPGFIPGNEIVYRIWSWEHSAEFISEPEYAIGNGEFGNGQFSLVSLSVLEGPVFDLRVYEHDFEIQVLNTGAEAEITLENTGLEELNITSITTTDEHFSAVPAELMVPPREEATVTITFTPTEAIEYEADIIFESNVPLHPEIAFPVRGEGYVLQGFDLSAEEHDFGRVPVETEFEWEFTVTNNVGELVEIGNIVSSDPAFTVSPDGLTLGDGEEATVSVAFSPDEAIQYGGTITLNMIEPVQADLMVTVQGIGSEGLIVPLTRNFFNLVSTCYVPEDLSAESVFNIEDLAIVYSHTGGFYLPGLINTLGNINLSHGYQLFVRETQTWEVEGPLLDPSTEYTITAGPWHWISYPFNHGVPITQALSAITDQVVIVYTDDGRLWIPVLGINTIGDQAPGEGFMIITNEDVTFTYNQDLMLFRDTVRDDQGEDDDWSTPIVENAPQPTGKPYAILIDATKGLKSLKPSLIEVYDNDLVVGKAIWLEDKPVTPVIAWEGSKEHDLSGFNPGNDIIVKMLDSNGTIIGEYQGGAKFKQGAYAEITVDAIDLNSQIPNEFALKSGYPNPFNPSIEIPFNIPRTSDVKIVVYNVYGQVVDILVDSQVKAGYHKVIWNSERVSTSVSSGMYFVKMEAKGFVKSQKIVLMK
ncbi:choice-of-anchor D domain-containing protein, partial [bacterium]|nr:choice-of-anchor D domain-containing protein [bacterium]